MLVLNTEKTFFVPFSVISASLPNYTQLTLHKINCVYFNYCSCTKIISKTNAIKYLGIYLDSHLKWDFHVTYLCKKLRFMLPYFKEFRHILNFDNLKRVYLCLVQSILLYGIIFWGAAYKSQLYVLEILQKYIIKIMYFKPKRYPSNDLYEEVNIFDIKQLYVMQLLKFSFRNRFILAPVDHQYTTRIRLNKKSTIRMLTKKYINIV